VIRGVGHFRPTHGCPCSGDSGSVCHCLTAAARKARSLPKRSERRRSSSAGVPTSRTALPGRGRMTFCLGPMSSAGSAPAVEASATQSPHDSATPALLARMPLHSLSSLIGRGWARVRSGIRASSGTLRRQPKLTFSCLKLPCCVDLRFRRAGDRGDSRSGTGKTGENGTGLIIDEVDDARYAVGMPRTARIAPGGMLFHVLNREDRIIRPVPF
jgi:hypothetical protein